MEPSTMVCGSVKIPSSKPSCISNVQLIDLTKTHADLRFGLDLKTALGRAWVTQIGLAIIYPLESHTKLSLKMSVRRYTPNQVHGKLSDSCYVRSHTNLYATDHD